MLLSLLTALSLIIAATAHQRRAPNGIAVTSHVFPLVLAPESHLRVPSSRYLHNRYRGSSIHPVTNDTLVDHGNATSPIDARAVVPSDLLTLGGRIYMANATLAGREYTFVIDTGSSDTWVATTTFGCINSARTAYVDQKRCGFGTLYDASHSSTIRPIPNYSFGVEYSDGEFLNGDMATEQLGIGGINEDQLNVRQTIGVVQRGYWMGDGVSSGLLGLAYPALASNVAQLNYTTVVFTLFQTGQVPPIFSLALTRPTVATPTPGGLLAIGGIPDIPTDGYWVSVPIYPIFYDTFAFYSIQVDGFLIIPPFVPGSRPPTMNYYNSQVGMIIDSGSSLNRFPDALADYIASLFSPPARYSATSDTYQVPCTATAPRVGVVVGGRSFWINEIDLMNKSPGAVREAVAGMCTVGIMRAGSSDSVLGDTWLKNVLAVFDVGAGQMRFSGREKY